MIKNKIKILILIVLSLSILTIANSTAPVWNVKSGQDNLACQGKIAINGSKADLTGFLLGAFGPGNYPDDCRGVTNLDKSGKYFFWVQSGMSGNKISLKLYDPKLDKVYDLERSFEFEANSNQINFDLNLIR